MPLPTFLLVGAAKAGTTSLFRHLEAHPDAFVSTPKEPRFFSAGALTLPHRGPGDDAGDRMAVRGWDAYRALFDGAGGAAAVGEASVETLYYWRTAIPEIRARLGRPKIVVALRDPVERAFSAYRFLVGHRRETLPFRRALRAWPERRAQNWEFIWDYAGGSRYAEGLEAFLESFPEVHVVLFEDFRADPAAVVGALDAFLGLGARDLEAPGAVHNAAKAPPRSFRLAAWRRGEGAGGRLLQAGRALVPAPARALVRDAADRWGVGGGRLSLGHRDRRALRAALADDAHRVEALLGRDLGPVWPTAR